MLLEFSVSNFRSLRKLQTLNLAARAQDRSLPENCIPLDLPGAGSKLWLKGAAIYGANASGKSSVIDALKALASLVTNSARMVDPKDPILQLEPFALRPGGEKVPTAFEVSFVAGGTRFSYRVAATTERIWHESLRAFPTARPQTWFSREWNEESHSYEWGPERPSGFARDSRLESDTLSNMLFLSKHIASNRTELEPIFRWFKEQLQFLHLSANWTLGDDFTLKQIKENTPLRKRIIDLLRHADIGVTDAKVVEEAPDSDFLRLLNEARSSGRRIPDDFLKPTLRAQLIHQGPKDMSFPLPWDSESAGTHRLFALAGPWLDILSRGRVVLIDELDTSMHPLMVIELLRLAFSEKENPNNAQVIFTTHNAVLLDLKLFRRDQVWFTNKNSEGEGHLYPLTDYAPRNTESLLRGYLSGRYDALPFMPSGLLGQNPTFHPIENTRKKSFE